MKKVLRRVSTCLMTTLLLCGLITTALAAEYSSSTKSVTVYGRDYEYWSSINSTDDTAVMYSSYVRALSNTPAGYIGQKTRLYSSAGSMVASGEYNYNANDYTAPTKWRFPWIYTDGTPGAYYYSKGEVKFYNGNGYSTYTCNASPNIRIPMSRMAVTMNESGEIYGSEIFLNAIGIEPDLIETVGDNGIFGYVRSSDLNVDDGVSNPSEAIQKTLEAEGQRVIPLYEVDGTTIIGTFSISLK